MDCMGGRKVLLAANIDFSTWSHVVRFMLELAAFLDYRCKSSLIFLHSFFNLLYYSYKMYLQSFEGLDAVVPELHQF